MRPTCQKCKADMGWSEAPPICYECRRKEIEGVSVMNQSFRQTAAHDHFTRKCQVVKEVRKKA